MRQGGGITANVLSSAAAARRLLPQSMTRQQVLDQYFMDARHKLIEVAAFLDCVDRSEGDADFRLAAFRTALKHLGEKKPHRAKRVLLSFSDPTTKPLAKATVKGATGAWPGKS